MFGLLLLFADDIKLFLKISMWSDGLKLQAYLTYSFLWSLSNDLPLSLEKCSYITFSRDSSFIVNDYEVSGTFLLRVNLIYDSGI